VLCQPRGLLGIQVLKNTWNGSFAAIWDDGFDRILQQILMDGSMMDRKVGEAGIRYRGKEAQKLQPRTHANVAIKWLSSLYFVSRYTLFKQQ
jgi:hypothetical protein